MKKIAIVELYGHYEVLYSFCNALRAFEVLVFTSMEGWEDAPVKIKSVPDKRAYLKMPSESVPSYIGNNKNVLDACDLIIFSTILGDYGFFAKQKWKAKTILVIHNGNYWLNYRNSIRIKSMLDVLRWLKSEWLREWPNRKEILKTIDFISFPNQLIQDYFIELGLVRGEEIFAPLPFYTPENNVYEIRCHNEITIVIPGTLSNESRDYCMLISTIKEIKKIGWGSESINFVLLGFSRKKYGRSIQDNFINMKNEAFKVTVFSKYITQEIYDHWMKKANFLILPLLREMSYGICSEIGSVTKISGTINDMLRFGIPSFIPSYYTIEEKQQCLVMQFVNSEDLAIQITNCIKHKTCIEIINEYKNELTEYSIKEIEKRVYSDIYKILG